MFAIEMETTIDDAGNVHLPEHYRQFYGKTARLLLLVSDDEEGIAISRLSEPALEKVWNNEDDAIYDQL
ncbi:hypothetical protein [Thiocystis violascens]|uniref:SpoVT-AbrB domain-containing protein n=1 Tax=Thiocystis violascens (strain ATCC 17096 / DSM 198 / 6111) TaxID=765911 RepID=I3YCS0_THIV6|nr:hypothetical protein [Thiocystis violascens]AFL74788.1 hypothetical protein Thivi_2877 [Thiocystis violascens DSM 198]